MHASWAALRSFIFSVPVAVTPWPLPLAKSWLDTTSAIQKFAVLVSEVPVSTDSQVVASVPLLEQAEPSHEDPAPTQALTDARWMVPSA